MRPILRLGSLNLALVAIYFVPVWGKGALRILLSPYSGFEDRAHAAAAIYLRELFDLGFEGLLRVSGAIAGLKLVIAAAFVAYLIEFARAVAVGREVDRQTSNGALALAATGVVASAFPGLLLADPALVRLSATQVMLVAGAVIVATVERHLEQTAKRNCLPPTASTTPVPGREPLLA